MKNLIIKQGNKRPINKLVTIPEEYELPNYLAQKSILELNDLSDKLEAEINEYPYTKAPRTLTTKYGLILRLMAIKSVEYEKQQKKEDETTTTITNLLATGGAGAGAGAGVGPRAYEDYTAIIPNKTKSTAIIDTEGPRTTTELAQLEELCFLINQHDNTESDADLKIIEKIRSLITKNPRILIRSINHDDQTTLLDLAAQQGKFKIVELLLQHNNEVIDAISNNNQNALIFAITNPETPVKDKIKTLEVLFKYKPDLITWQDKEIRDNSNIFQLVIAEAFEKRNIDLFNVALDYIKTLPLPNVIKICNHINAYKLTAASMIQGNLNLMLMNPADISIEDVKATITENHWDINPDTYLKQLQSLTADFPGKKDFINAWQEATKQINDASKNHIPKACLSPFMSNTMLAAATTPCLKEALG